MKHGLFAVVLGLVSASAFAQTPAPFGIRMGMQKSELRIAEKLSDTTFILASVPRPNGDFEYYAVSYTPKTGVCFVKAMGRDITTEPTGFHVRLAFDETRKQLEAIYGPSKLLDSVMPGTIWLKPQDFTMAILNKERVLSADWEHPAGLKRVFLYLFVTSASKANVVVEFYFPNHDTCDAEITAASRSTFQ